MNGDTSGSSEEARDIALIERELGVLPGTSRAGEEVPSSMGAVSGKGSHTLNSQENPLKAERELDNNDIVQITTKQEESNEAIWEEHHQDIHHQSDGPRSRVNASQPDDDISFVNHIDTANNSSHNSIDPFANLTFEGGVVGGGGGEPAGRASQGRPAEIANLTAEVLFVLVCSTGQLLFSFLAGNIAGLQLILVDMLQIDPSQTPWLLGSFLLANGLSVIVSGPLADLCPAKFLICGALAWQTLWNIIGIFSLSNKYLFFIVRANQGLTVGVLVSASISVLGRIYQPGIRKTRVFSIMAGMAPLGFWLGNLQGGALYRSPKWIFASSAIMSGICLACGIYAIPNVKPAIHTLGFRSFDFTGSAAAVTGCALIVAGLTQGPSANWMPYTIVIVMLGLLSLVAFFFIERVVQRPLLPPALWKVPGFTPLILSYFLGFGSFMAWQFFALQFWLEQQHASPLTVALYLTPNAIFGCLATFIVSRIAHLVAGHWILAASMVSFALGPVFFLPQTPNTIYWALSMPGIAIATFGPDLSFAAASIFVTSSVAKSYQGSAGSLLVTVQNLSAAIMVSLSESIGDKVIVYGSAMERLQSIWWFNFASAMVAAIITLAAVRIPKTVEKEHEM